MSVFNLIIISMLISETTCGLTLGDGLDLVNAQYYFVTKTEQLLESTHYNISFQCIKDLKSYAEGLRQIKLWAWRMLDAGGKIQSGILEGNVVDLGYFDECMKVKNIVTSSNSISGKYCIGTIPFEVFSELRSKQLQSDSQNFGFQPRILTRQHRVFGIHLATCLPDSCSANDVQKMYKGVLSKNVMTFKEEMCQSSKTINIGLDSGSIATLSFIGMILVLIIVSTVYDVSLYYSGKKNSNLFLITFSIFTNGNKLIKTNEGSSEQISCLYGIRVMTIMWIILGHTYSLRTMFPIRNSLEAATDWFHQEVNMFIIGAPLAVDTFFLLSGTVLVYIYMTVTKSKFNILLFYLHRYLRLTPIVAFMALVHVTLIKHIGSGPLWPTQVQEILIKGCEKNWWRALLYIQNYAHPEEMCVPQSWYLSVDMQLFVLSPIILLPLKAWPRPTLLCIGFLAICSGLASFLTGWFFEFDQNLLRANLDIDNFLTYMKFYYFALWTRAPPWLIGLILGYFLSKTKSTGTEFKINKKFALVTWAGALTVLCSCLFAGHEMYTGEYNKLANSFYMALARPSWAVAVGWVIWSCATGRGGPINWFLSLPVFQVLSRLTYTLFMVHYTIIIIKYAQVRVPATFDNSHALSEFWGNFALSCAVAISLSLAFESPVIAIEKIIFKR